MMSGWFIRMAFYVGFVGLLLWLAGFIAFATHIKGLDVSSVDMTNEPTDAIVVLTGGSERVETGIDLLRADKGKKLFISGVNPRLNLADIPGAKEFPNAIVLGRTAATTEGNAEETREWMVLENFHSLRLVTANYHMPRSLLMFHAAMPDVMIVPHPVAPDTVKLDDWWLHIGTASLLASEYNKYLSFRCLMALGWV